MRFLHTWLVVVSIVFATEASDTWVVKRGDNLWDISSEVYWSTRYSHLIMGLNNIPSENALRVGDTLDTPPLDSIWSRSGLDTLLADNLTLLKDGARHLPKLSRGDYRDTAWRRAAIARGKKGEKMLREAVAGIRSRCDDLGLGAPQKALRRFESVAREMGRYDKVLNPEYGETLVSKELDMCRQYLAAAWTELALWGHSGPARKPAPSKP